jgi:putative salt-induced outer membrane protein YdiY
MKTIPSLAFLLLAHMVLADEVTMKNGDRLSGTILKTDGPNLIMKSEFAGEVKIAWDAITAVGSSVPINVGLKDGQVLAGTVTTQDGNFQVATSAGTVSAPKDSVQFIRNQAEQVEVERHRNPRLVDLWIGTMDLGFAQTHGNVDTATFSLSGNASRTTSRDKISAYYTSVFSSSDASGTHLTTANAKRGGVGYNRNLRKRLFAFGLADLETDQFQSLDLRIVPAGGLGYHAINTERTALDLSGGIAENREYFSTGLKRTSTEILAGEELNRKLTGAASLHERFVFFPNVTDTGSYRMNFDTSAVAAIAKWMSWQITVSDRYLSNPLAGRKSNDILFTTGLRLTFAK